MNLVIDQGNTVTKMALFDSLELVELSLYDTFNAAICNAFLRKQNVEIEACIFSSVAEVTEDILIYLNNKFEKFLVVDRDTKLPIENLYKTPNTLGADRIAAVVGAKEFFENKNVLVIDIGTAITYDFITEEGAFLGGNISPGITHRFKALHFFTGKLPLVDRYGALPDIGFSTETAIRSGVVKGVAYEIDSYINEYKLRYTNIEVFLTGGHAGFIKTQLKNNIFVEPNLVLKGLNRILNYNVYN